LSTESPSTTTDAGIRRGALVRLFLLALAVRQRKPVSLSYDAASGEVRITDVASDTIYHRRALRNTSEYMLDGVTMTPSSVQVYPNGVSSSAFTIRLANGEFVRRLTVARTGFSRVTVN
jgi:hypothetical protein